MEYLTGAITLQTIFSLNWELYLSWYKGKIRDAVTCKTALRFCHDPDRAFARQAYENVRKIMQCRTPMLGFLSLSMSTLFKCKINAT